MKGPTKESRALLASLWKAPGVWDRVLGRSAWNVSIIEKLGQSAETAVISYLAPALGSDDKPPADAAASAIATVLRKTQVEDLPALDEEMRRPWYLESWYELKPGRLERLIDAGQLASPWPELLSMHVIGFVREEAVRRLSHRRDGTELPYLLLRVNDWVSQVRDVARDAVLHRVTPDRAAAFVRSLPLIVRLQRARRSDHRELLERITGLLGGPEARPSMLVAMTEGAKIVRRASFRILTAAGSRSQPEVLQRAFEGRDSVIRLWAARATADAFDGEELRSRLNVLSRDPAPPVRQLAIRTLAARFGDEAAAALQSALLDRSASVRAEARFHLRGGDERQFTSLYRDALASARGRDLRGAIGGLTETGAAEDAGALVNYLSHPLASIRAITAVSLVKLAGDADECLAERARNQISRWDATFNRRQETPTPAQVTDLEKALAVAGSGLPPRVADPIRFALRPFSTR